MPLIITATDFSSVAENAVNYSCNLAMTQNAQVVIIHSFIFPVMFSDIPLPTSLINDTQKDAETKMNTVIDNLHILYPKLDISGKVIYGNIIDAIDVYSEDNAAPSLVIVGNSNTIENNAWFESTLREASRNIKYPLLAVPPEAAYKPILKVCLAYDNNPKGNDIALVQLRETAMQLNAELHVFNAQTDVLNRDNITEIDPKFKELLAPANPHFHFEYAVNIDDAILEFNEKNNIDLLIMIPRKHSFFEGLFHKSHTKAIAQNSPIPILMLHENLEN